MLLSKRNALKLAAAGFSYIALTAGMALADTKIDFYYPVQVGGPVTKVVDGYVQKFMEANPGITVAPIYAGNYNDTTTKALTAAKAGTPPAVAVLLATDVYTLIDEDVIDPIDDFIKTAEDKAWLAGFMPAYLKSAQTEDHLWSVPFQRSTAVMYYNKQAFKDAGLDPEKYPTTWDEMVAAGKAVTAKDAAGQVTRWGVGIAGNVGSAQWLFGALVAQNGGTLVNEAGTETYLTDPKVVEALQYWVDLSTKDAIHPPGIFEWGTAPADFLAGRVAMIWHTTGNLANIRKNATFDFGIAPFPGHPTPASVLGGGNLYIFKDASDEEKAAAYKFIQFLTSDEILADWAVQTGYVAPRDGSWETETMKKYVAEAPQALVALKQIPASVPEFSTHENARATKILNDALAAALTGNKTAEAALAEAQDQIDRILKPYR
ncbi:MULTISPECIES: ABC transporter substrate-binding protein [unclassified Shinella]|uniref:ABC transporter substrate-binding protein n=1 Tax=unclassified Shinella TaxID=2643062 RepID=UPI00234E791B|nr:MULTISPECIES: ABC transporter substrate-binding protein [unclassified Shinella]MCO5148784.1 ABC transporter substrate-binding protein [Shinella sp.]MDC7264845.1 ABC transporter substrate-binding protein [Shinella sp. HY16]MDC7271742.1 ABC transporter substrate-binding protein [Shinella sp. YZ44]